MCPAITDVSIQPPATLTATASPAFYRHLSEGSSSRSRPARPTLPLDIDTVLAEARNEHLEAPNEDAILAGHFLSLLLRGEVSQRAYPSEDGGLSVLFRRGQAHSTVELLNDGLVLLSGGVDGNPHSVTVEESRLAPTFADALKLSGRVRRILGLADPGAAG